LNEVNFTLNLTEFDNKFLERKEEVHWSKNGE